MSDVPHRIHRAEVLSVTDLVPGLRRFVFGGEGLADFETTGVGDEYLRIFLPDEPTGEPRMPFAVGRGWDWPEGVEPSPLRTYTVRAWDAERHELTVDVVLHDGGLAAEWARTAAVGAVVAVNSPNGMYDAPADLEWQVLVTDLTGLPAATRILQQTDPRVRSRLIVEAPSAAQRFGDEIPSAVDVQWVTGGNGVAPSRIEQLVRGLEQPEGVGYLWVVGESRVLRNVRKHVRHELGRPASSYKIVAYWTENAEEWNARWAALDPTVRKELEDMWDTERDEEEIEDEYFARLTELGL
ncbi:MULTISPECIES: siderophore-interacting protein [unclassified Nocardioides]|uniref:siderophore-interacting protein n=1 Tax=unclassified Nocardioides TaxID=2615069 RepID=UPI00301554EC